MEVGNKTANIKCKKLTSLHVFAVKCFSVVESLTMDMQMKTVNSFDSLLSSFYKCIIN